MRTAAFTITFRRSRLVSPDGIKPSDLLPGDVCTTTTGPTCDFVYTGYRIPLIVVSPYTKKNYVSHTVTDTTAILKLIETRFNVPALTKRDAAQTDMTEFFDFSNPPWITPPTPPAQSYQRSLLPRSFALTDQRPPRIRYGSCASSA